MSGTTQSKRRLSQWADAPTLDKLARPHIEAGLGIGVAYERALQEFSTAASRRLSRETLCAADPFALQPAKS